VYNNDSYQAEATPPSGIFQPIPHVFLGNEDKEGQGPKVVKEPSNMAALRNNYVDRIISTKSQLSKLLLTSTGQDHADVMASFLQLELLRHNFTAKYDDRFYGKKTMQNVYGFLQKNGTFEMALTDALLTAKQHLEKGSLSSTSLVRPDLIPTIDVHTLIHTHTHHMTRKTHTHSHTCINTYQCLFFTGSSCNFDVLLHRQPNPARGPCDWANRLCTSEQNLDATTFTTFDTYDLRGCLCRRDVYYARPWCPYFFCFSVLSCKAQTGLVRRRCRHRRTAHREQPRDQHSYS
jgi:hypothetical protein